MLSWTKTEKKNSHCFHLQGIHYFAFLEVYTGGFWKGWVKSNNVNFGEGFLALQVFPFFSDFVETINEGLKEIVLQRR